MTAARKIYEGWFAIGTPRSSDIEDRAQELESEARKDLVSERGEITKKGWDTIGDDIAKIEQNALKWLQKIFERGFSEGHDDDQLVGGFEFNAHDDKQMDVVNLGVERGINSSELDPFVWKGVSRFGIALLDVDIYLNVDEDDLRKANALADWEKTTHHRRD